MKTYRFLWHSISSFKLKKVSGSEVWSMEVRASLRETLDRYLIQRTASEGIKFVVCLGPFKSKEEAEKQRPALADAMQTPLLIEEVENTAAPQERTPGTP